MEPAFIDLPPAPQAELPDAPYDRWVNPDGGTSAEFRRREDGFLIRFPDQADFLFDPSAGEVRCTPVGEQMDEVCRTLFRNALVPLAGNHSGGLFLHGSAASIAGTGIAFLGASRRGKTTLAGAFAQAGYPFITEDAVELRPDGAGRYTIIPTRPVLRLFGDSARHLLGSDAPEGKNALDASGMLPFAEGSQPLGGLYLLGEGKVDETHIAPLPAARALSEIMQHSFILDVEDRARLRGHFGRLATLTGTVPCFALDFPRRYDQLPAIVEAIASHARKEGPDDAA